MALNGPAISTSIAKVSIGASSGTAPNHAANNSAVRIHGVGGPGATGLNLTDALAAGIPAPPLRTGSVSGQGLSAPSTTQAAQQASGPKQDQQLQNQMMAAMLNKMMKEQEAGAKAKRPDGSIDTKKLDEKVVKELEKLHEGMKDYAKQMDEKIKDIEKDLESKDPPTRERYAKVTPLMKDFVDAVKKNSNPSVDNKEFNPEKIIKKYDALEKAIKEQGIENDPKVKEFMEIAKKARDQAEVMDKIATGNNATLLNARDQLVTDSKDKLAKVDSSDPKLDKLNKSKQAVLEASEGLQLNGNKPGDKDYDAATKKFQDSLTDYKQNVDAIQKDPSVKAEIKQAAKESLKPLELLQETQTLIPQSSFKAKLDENGKPIYKTNSKGEKELQLEEVPEQKAKFREYSEKHSNYVRDLSTENGKFNPEGYRDYYIRGVGLTDKDIEEGIKQDQQSNPRPSTPDTRRENTKLDIDFGDTDEQSIAETDIKTEIDTSSLDSLVAELEDLDLEADV